VPNWSNTGVTRQYRADEVEGMTSEEFGQVRHEAAMYQRDRPEAMMRGIQRKIGGGVYSHAIEHVGDLTHRMNEMGGKLGLEFVRPKVEKMHGSLHGRYGFEREMTENIVGNKPLGYADANAHREFGKLYAAEHRLVPVYNEPSATARFAAVSLGEHNFPRVRTALNVLMHDTKSPEHWNELTSQATSVKFLRKQEELWG
jgi:hypothetical protein